METMTSILIVDDTSDNLLLLSELLSSRGYIVYAVKSGEQAIKKLESLIPDLILLDINMPEMDGFETCKRIKKMPFAATIPIIFITGYDNVDNIVTAFKVGAVDYITKPFRSEEVIARVETHLHLYRQKIQIQEQHDALQKLERERDNLVNMLIHDLRSPLATISFNIDSFNYLGPGESVDKSLIAEILSEIDRLIEMISSILDVSRMEENKLPLSFSSVEMCGLVASETDKLSVIVQRSGIELLLPEKETTIECDKKIIGRVLRNLISNAIKFTPEKGVVEITMDVEDSFVKVSVRDTGPGIPKEAREVVFEKFAQLKEGQKRQRYSSGLGLTFCKMVIEAHGGEIGVNSELHKGSVFWFTLPINNNNIYKG